jgi:roadblock/LC7 domain-containing protein
LQHSEHEAAEDNKVGRMKTAFTSVYFVPLVGLTTQGGKWTVMYEGSPGFDTHKMVHRNHKLHM